MCSRCLFIASLLHVALKKIFRQLWIDFLQFIVLVQRTFSITKRDKIQGQIEMSFAIIRLDSSRFLKSSRRLTITLGSEVNRAEVVIRLGIRRL